METTERKTVYLNAVTEWRRWLEQNHHTEQSVWVICNNKKSKLPTVGWSELVDEALCFGWIDSTRKTIDEGSFMQFFSRRKSNSTWSKINKEKVERLIEEKLMTKEGYESIRIAKQNGSWEILDSVEKLLIPVDLEAAFENYNGSKEYFLSLSKSLKKMLLHWIVMAKRPETRKNRINEIAKEAGRENKPRQFR